MKKLTSVVLTLVMIFSIMGTNVAISITVQASNSINIGDYVQMGKYYDEPILWRCVDIDENGPLMLSNSILAIKPFDAAGEHKYLDGTGQADMARNYRSLYGSNLWETSNIRSWLNSTEAAGNVTWLDDCPPTTTRNGYANEKGFLADGNFSENERNNMKSVTQKSLLNIIDNSKLKEDGSAIHKYLTNISTVVQNYDTAYYHDVTDKMFLLDVKQINKVYLNSYILGDDYYIGKPTQKAVDNSEVKTSKISTSSYCANWLRTPSTDLYSHYLVRSINSVDYVIDNYAKNDETGVRAAFYIDLASVIFESGNGALGTPYVVSSEKNTLIPTIKPTPTGEATPEPTSGFIAQSGDFTFELIDNGTNVIIVDYTGSGGDIIIPNTYYGKNVTAIGNDAFFYCTKMTSITIPNTVTSIGNYAFSNCTGLTSVIIPNSVTCIRKGAFQSCTGLTQITVDDNNSIFSSEDGVLFDKARTSIIKYPEGKKGSYIIENGVNSIGDNAIYHCEGLTSVTIPNSVTSIGDSALAHCYGLTSVTIPDSVTSTGDSAFAFCTGLTNVTVPNSVTSIGAKEFDGCSGLTNVTIPNSVTSIGSNAFSGCTGLTNIEIPNSVISIGDSAFYNCDELTNVTIPNSVISIGDGAFKYCSRLTNVTIPNRITRIENELFFNCTRLTSVIIPDSVTSIDTYAFFSCSGLISVTIPDNVTNIGNFVFSSCSKLTIYSKEGSLAQQYAVQNSIPFVDLNMPTTTPTATPISESTPIPTLIPSDATIITVGSVYGLPDTNVNISVNITANSGLAAGDFTLCYDTTKLEVVSVSSGEVVSSFLNSMNIDKNKGTIKNSFAGDPGTNLVGSILDVTFKIKSTAKGTISLTLTNSEFINDNFDNIPYAITQGAINVIMMGDVTGDEQVTTVDALKVLNEASGKAILTDSGKIAADVTKNGKIQSTDALKILKYCSGKITEF